MKEILGQPSWTLQSNTVSMSLTRLGAHMAPVEFCCGASPVQPYYISPWQGSGEDVPEGLSEVPQRGDFFCMPFGFDRSPYAQEKHPPHGETAVAPWELVAETHHKTLHTLSIERTTKARPGVVRRSFSLVDGEDVVYDETVIQGFQGPTTFAHHALLRPPSGDECLLLSTSPIRFGHVYPHPFADADCGEHQALQPGARFDSLQHVPGLVAGRYEDCSVWPARKGRTDLLQIANICNDASFAWTAAVNPEEGYVWFALKNVQVLPSVVLWMDYCGRHKPPYSGRTCVLGLEDACTFFDRGIAESAAPNLFSQEGVRTHFDLTGEAFPVRYIQGVSRVPQSFGRVTDIAPDGAGIVLCGEAGQVVHAAVQWRFLHGLPLTH